MRTDSSESLYAQQALELSPLNFIIRIQFYHKFYHSLSIKSRRSVVGEKP